VIHRPVVLQCYNCIPVFAAVQLSSWNPKLRNKTLLKKAFVLNDKALRPSRSQFLYLYTCLEVA